MNALAKLTIGVLAAVVLALGITVVVMAVDHDGDHMRFGNDGYWGMMPGHGGPVTDAMLERMRSVLSEEDYAQMLDLMAEHHASGAMHFQGGMMHSMPGGWDGAMPMWPR